VSRKTTWAPHTKQGWLTAQSDLPDSVFAFPHQRKEPLTDAAHVRNALARPTTTASRSVKTIGGTWNGLTDGLAEPIPPG
jgi:hypothetical protein